MKATRQLKQERKTWQEIHLWNLNTFKFSFHLFNIYESFAFMYVYAPLAPTLSGSEDDTRSSGNSVTDGCELPSCGGWEPHLGPPKDQQILLIDELSLQPLKIF